MYDFISCYAPHLDLNYIHQPEQWLPVDPQARDRLLPRIAGTLIPSVFLIKARNICYGLCVAV